MLSCLNECAKITPTSPRSCGRTGLPTNQALQILDLIGISNSSAPSPSRTRLRQPGKGLGTAKCVQAPHARKAEWAEQDVPLQWSAWDFRAARSSPGFAAVQAQHQDMYIRAVEE